MNAGYSKTPLAKKLGIKAGYSILLIAAPEYYFDLFDEFPKNVTHVKSSQTESADFIHLFAKDYATLALQAEKCKGALKKNGTLWVSWPKGASQLSTDLNREQVREYLLKMGLVDTKVAAIDDTWSGLKFMLRLKDR